MALIYDNVDIDNILICHSKYFLSFDYNGTCTDVLINISNNKYKNLHLKPIKEKLSEELYKIIMDKYTNHTITSINFSSYSGKTAVDFICIPQYVFDEIIDKYCDPN